MPNTHHSHKRSLQRQCRDLEEELARNIAHIEHHLLERRNLEDQLHQTIASIEFQIRNIKDQLASIDSQEEEEGDEVVVRLRLTQKLSSYDGDSESETSSTSGTGTGTATTESEADSESEFGSESGSGSGSTVMPMRRGDFFVIDDQERYAEIVRGIVRDEMEEILMAKEAEQAAAAKKDGKRAKKLAKRSR
ncbi:hypothetical protein VTL71DRAFT_1570 [Oculimacula yallundae]|uniref:Uncharacterized protein n=1 Tax=Oculimacula yallundae TaxID=86028 RepID=A0ABR4CCF0_9HELO